MKTLSKNLIRLFVIESPNPLDALAGRAEGPAISTIARLIGHQALYYQVRSQSDFQRLCAYIGSVGDIENDSPEVPMCMHISAHGNKNSLLLGGDDVGWENIVEDIQPFIKFQEDRCGHRILVLSACGAEGQKITTIIRNLVLSTEEIDPPLYLFCTVGDIPWDAATVAWALFYHLLSQADITKKRSIQDILKKITFAGLPKLMYFRWDKKNEKYLKYTASK